MGLRERMYELTTPEEVAEFMERFPTCALFKAGGCHKTMQGFGYVEEALAPYEEIHLGFVKVIESRPASNYIAETTQIQHESPQIILLKEKSPVFELNNWDITPEFLQEGLMHHLGASKDQKSQEEPVNTEDIAFYIDLLEKFTSREIEESEFRDQWLSSFQADASLRSTKEFNLLNGLFGDVDDAIDSDDSNPLSLIGKVTSVREKAEKLLEDLKVTK